MRRWRAAISVLCGLTLCAQTAYATPLHMVESDTHSVLYRDFLLTMLTPYIQQAIDARNKGRTHSIALYTARFDDIKRLCAKGQFYFEATVSVETFTCAHNAPYGLETIKLTNSPQSKSAHQPS